MSMRYVLSGKFLTSKMFIALSVLALAVYMFSLAVKKKQGDFHLSEIKELEELKSFVVENKEVQKTLFQKIKWTPEKFRKWHEEGLNDTSSLSALTSRSTNNYLQSEKWQMLHWMKNKTWLDIIQSELPKVPEGLGQYGEAFVRYSSNKNVLGESRQRIQQQMQFNFFSQLIHQPKQRLETLLHFQKQLGAYFYAEPNLALQMAKDIVALSWDLERQNLLAKEESLLNNEELKYLQVFHFLMQSDMYLNFSQEKHFSWTRKDPFYCHYADQNYRHLAMVAQVGDSYVFSPEEGVEESYKFLLATKKRCGLYVKDLSFEQWKTEVLKAYDLSLPAGDWDLNRKLENQNFFLQKIRELLVRKIRAYQ